MRNYDFSPLYRSMIGLDHMKSLLDSATRESQSLSNYPPYNIEQFDENNYQIVMAVAGFDQSDLVITSENNSLLIEGKRPEDKIEHHYLHRGIAERSFKHRFQLAEHVKISAANLKNGLLYIDLKREIPDAIKPKNIPIGSDVASDNKSVEEKTHKASIKAA